jgi:DNA-binding CsgD family transcriptional regulator
MEERQLCLSSIHIRGGLMASKRTLKFGLELTPAESEVLLMRFQGMTLEEIAEVRGTSSLTARNQLQWARKKMGFSSKVRRVDDGKLTPAEWAVLKEVAKGKTPHEVAEERGTSYHTVRNQLNSAYLKLSVNSRAQACIRLYQWGLLD